MRDAPLDGAIVSDWLRRWGSLPIGSVTEVQVEQTIETSISTLSFATVTYTPDAPADLPRKVVIKSPHIPFRAPGGSGGGEVDFYRRVAPIVGIPPVVRCLGAVDPSDDAPEIIVLEDLRATHDHPPWPLPPSLPQCQLALSALVSVHAPWWNATALGRTVGERHTTESLTSMVQGIAAHLPAFLDAVGDALSTEGRGVYERVFGSALRPWLRLTDTRALTVVHGDAHGWNFLFPRTSKGPAYLVDWQLWHVDVGARDLAFMMALHWYPSRRREHEQPLLRYYHDRLLEHGINDYAFEDLWLDYRRCAVRNLTLPILFWSRGMKPEGWWHRLECALAAYQDLDCAELL